jgi:hypothetical protein
LAIALYFLVRAAAPEALPLFGREVVLSSENYPFFKGFSSEQFLHGFNSNVP